MLQCVVLILLSTPVFSAPEQSPEATPVFAITPVQSKVTFYVKSSVKLEGTFEKWGATLVFTSTDASTGVLDVKIHADSVNSGSKSKDEKLKGEHCFDVEKDPYITFHSTKITRTGPNTFDVAGILPSVASRNPRASPSRLIERQGEPPARSKGVDD